MNAPEMSVREAAWRRARERLKRVRLKDSWPAEFEDGARCAFTQHFSGDRERGGYPKGFHVWPLAKRDAWFCGYNYGRLKRLSGVAS
jgi:hypothetical protein